MKTIDQAAKELFPDCNNESDQKTVEMFREIFRKGAKFAQQWISVEDELPELKDKPYQVLVKSITGHIETYHVIDRKSQHFIKEFIEWRPVELK